VCHVCLLTFHHLVGPRISPFPRERAVERHDDKPPPILGDAQGLVGDQAMAPHGEVGCIDPQRPAPRRKRLVLDPERIPDIGAPSAPSAVCENAAMNDDPIADIVAFWLGDSRDCPARAHARRGWWYEGGPTVDEAIRVRFGDLVTRACARGLMGWRNTPHRIFDAKILIQSLFFLVPFADGGGTATAFLPACNRTQEEYPCPAPASRRTA